jgi:hypothetical protein
MTLHHGERLHFTGAMLQKPNRINPHRVCRIERVAIVRAHHCRLADDRLPGQRKTTTRRPSEKEPRSSDGPARSCGFQRILFVLACGPKAPAELAPQDRRLQIIPSARERPSRLDSRRHELKVYIIPPPSSISRHRRRTRCERRNHRTGPPDSRDGSSPGPPDPGSCGRQ